MTITGNPLIISSLHDLLSKNGFLSFEDYMTLCLFHSKSGYYSSKKLTIDARGDFTTCIQLDPLLGKGIAKWMVKSKNIFPKGEKYHIIELGSGSGKLAKIIHQELPASFRRRMEYHIVEINPGLIKEQKKRLESFPDLSWHTSIDEALQASGENVILLSIEFIDTFPTRIFQWHDDNWFEVYITIVDDKIQEILKQPDPPLPIQNWPTFLSAVPRRPGQRVELHSSFFSWWTKWNSKITRGKWLIIDYGDIFPNIYYRRPHGTIRAYWQHFSFTGMDVYERLGTQDLTADVNFSDVLIQADNLGWTKEFFTSQRDFLTKYALPGSFRIHFSKKPETEAQLFNMDPLGAGSHFKVLDLKK